MDVNQTNKRPGHVIIKRQAQENGPEPIRPKPGCSFSALINSMLPLDSSSEIDPDSFTYDEFGFKISTAVDCCDDTHGIRRTKNEAKFAQPFLEDPKHKLKWIAYLEFNVGKVSNEYFSSNNEKTLDKCERLKNLIRSQGIPHSLRSYTWLRLSGALVKKSKSTFTYKDLLQKSQNDSYHTSKQIEKDLLRTLPTNFCFANCDSVGIPRLRRILQAIAWLYPNVGYCQGMGPVVATLLLFNEEEDAFWQLCTIIENILPVSYYSHTLIGVQADIKVLKQLMSTYLPQIDALFKSHEIEISMIAINWFLTLFSNNMHMRVLLRAWDLLFYDGSIVLFHLSLSMLKSNETRLLKCESSSEVYNTLNDLPSEVEDMNRLLEVSIQLCSSISQDFIDILRRKQQAYLMAENGTLINPNNYKTLPFHKERTQLLKANLKNRNLLKRFKTFVNAGGSSDAQPMTHDDSQQKTTNHVDEMKMKNIVQTETLLNLREIVVKIIRHFQQYDNVKYKACSMHADYSIESHTNDYIVFNASTSATTTGNAYKHAKGLVDFDRIDADELSFRKNDIIKVLSIKDEHCWIGQLDTGEKGWFPATFVELIDERNGREYSLAGDDSTNESIMDLIRDQLCTILKQIFEYGLKKWNILSGSVKGFKGHQLNIHNLITHPWSFVESAIRKIIEKDINSVYSRLILCETYRLDENNNKILTPEELLFNCIKTINKSHDKYKMPMDVKFRSFVCMALNEQVLHIWLEILCSNIEVIEKTYEPWSFLRSPAWVQIKCELRLLSQFAFNLNVDAELPVNGNDLLNNESIKDMLIKHHLFSWDIN